MSKEQVKKGRTTVGLVGAGYMGSAIGWDLQEGGTRVVTTVTERSPRTVRLAQAAGLNLLPSLVDVLAAADILLVITPPASALAAAKDIVAATTGITARPLVADLNAISPMTVRNIAGMMEGAGLPFVDGAISGPPPNIRPGARVYLSGECATIVEKLPWRRANAVDLQGPIGHASALKMCTGSIYNGVQALVTQAIRTADHYGVLPAMLADFTEGIGTTDPGAIAVAATKAHRFIAEMREIASTQEGADLSPKLFEAFEQIWVDVSSTALAAGVPESTSRTLTVEEVARLLRRPL